MLGLYPDQTSQLQKLTSTGTLWISNCEAPRGPCWGVLTQQSWGALAATAARFGYPNAKKDDLHIATLNGFSGPAARPAKITDHTQDSLAIVQRYLEGDRPDLIVIASLSQIYETALTIVGGTTPLAQFKDSVGLIPAFAGASVTHLVWDFVQSGIPVIASYWDVNNKPFLPMGVQRMAAVRSDSLGEVLNGLDLERQRILGRDEPREVAA